MIYLYAVLLLAAPATPSPTPMSLDAAPVATATPSLLDTPIRAATPTATPAPAATAAPKRLAVIVAGQDTTASGDLQRELEKRIAVAVQGLVVRSAGDDAVRIGAPRPPVAAPVADAATAALMEQAIGAYYDAQYVRALDLFAKAQGNYENSAAPASKKTEVILWRVAVFLGLNDATQAQTEALAALTLNPEIKVDSKSEIPPSVQQQLDQARTSASFKQVTVIVNGLPPTASLTVDGRSVPSRFKVVPGKHFLVISSNLRGEVRRDVDISADTAITVSLPVQLTPESDAAIQTLIAGAENETEISSISKKLDADWVLFATVNGTEVRTALRRTATGVVDRGGPFTLAEAPAKIVDLYQKRLSRSLTDVPDKGPLVTSDGWAIRSDATLLASGWLRSVSGGETFQTFLAGGGPELRVEAENGWKVLAGSASYVSYDASSVDVKLPDGSKTTASGGSTARLIAGGGWRGGGPEGGRFRALGSLDFETHGATDPKNGGAPLNLMTGYTRVAIEARGGFHSAAPGLEGWIMDLELGVSPYAYFGESPSNATGKTPSSAPAYLWSAALVSEPSSASRWGYRVAYAGEMRSVKFHGTSEAAVSPAMRDATLSEMYHALSLSITRRF